MAISRSDALRCDQCLSGTPTAIYDPPGDPPGAVLALCADCLVAGLEAATPWRWRGSLASYRATSRVKDELAAQRERDKHPHSGKRGRVLRRDLREG